MPYSDPTTVRLVLSSISAETGGTAADLSDDQINYELNSASSMIDSELRVQYVVPFDPVPDMIRTICTDVAAYRCDLNYRKSREYDSQNMPIIQRYNMALSWLMELKKGGKTLDSPRADITKQGALVIHQYPYPLLDWESVTEPFPRW